MNQILTKLDEIFAPMDAEVLASSQEWAKGRMKALHDFKASEEYQSIRRDAYKLYAKLFAIAGGKTWYNVFNGNTEAVVAKFVAKNCAATIAKRNDSIAKKLTKAGVTEVISEKFTHTKDGFNGIFIVHTNNGTKTVKIETVHAGGYNIQCLHLRVLVSVK